MLIVMTERTVLKVPFEKAALPCLSDVPAPLVSNLINLFSGVLRCRFWGNRGRRPLGSDTEGGDICLAPSVFWQVIPNWQQEIRNSRQRQNQNAAKTCFFLVFT